MASEQRNLIKTPNISIPCQTAKIQCFFFFKYLGSLCVDINKPSTTKYVQKTVSKKYYYCWQLILGCWEFNNNNGGQIQVVKKSA